MKRLLQGHSTLIPSSGVEPGIGDLSVTNVSLYQLSYDATLSVRLELDWLTFALSYLFDFISRESNSRHLVFT